MLFKYNDVFYDRTIENIRFLIKVYFVFRLCPYFNRFILIWRMPLNSNQVTIEVAEHSIDDFANGKLIIEISCEDNSIGFLRYELTSEDFQYIFRSRYGVALNYLFDPHFRSHSSISLELTKLNPNDSRIPSITLGIVFFLVLVLVLFINQILFISFNNFFYKQRVLSLI
jgi:hypothetical protein